MKSANISLKPFRLAVVFAAFCIFVGSQDTPAQKTQTEVFLETLNEAEAKTNARQWTEAAALWEKIVKINPVEARYWNQLGNAHYNGKNYAGAIKAYDKVLEIGGTPSSSAAYNIACNYALMGEKEQALKWLEKSLEMGFPDLAHVQSDTDLRSLRGDARFQKLVGSLDASKMSREEGWRFDLQLLAREVKRKAYAKFRGAREVEFTAGVKKLDDAIPNLTDGQIIVEFAKLTRLVGDGHTGLLGGNRPEFVQTLPVQFYLFEEGLFIISADPKYRDLLGAEVLKFGDRTSAEMVKGLEPIIARDNEIWIKQVAPYRLRHLSLLNALGLIPDAQKVALSLRLLNGKEQVLTIAADTTEPNIWNVKPNPEKWINLAQTLSQPAPLYLKNASAPYWFEYLADRKTVYFQFNSVRNDPKESLAAFSERLFKFVDETDVEKLVIDMRWNNGGNTFLLTPLVQGLIKNEKINRRGRLFVIIGRRVFSAAQNAATYFERSTNATFVGEPTGSSPNFVGEEDPFVLPYSKIMANVSDLYWESAFPMDERTWIAPQIYVPPTFEAYRANRDAALEAILDFRMN
ncbi:MAG TPA: tetratricopeptide repeat protein [Pyrinomonadaceae bacterium]|jgi:tetratricopeptide (TPR) repeat protein